MLEQDAKLAELLKGLGQRPWEKALDEPAFSGVVDEAPFAVWDDSALDDRLAAFLAEDEAGWERPLLAEVVRRRHASASSSSLARRS